MHACVACLKAVRDVEIDPHDRGDEEESSADAAMPGDILRALTDASLLQRVAPESRTLGRLAWHLVQSQTDMLNKAGLAAFAYIALVVASSVYLAWHYAIDGYVAIALTVAVYTVVRLMLNDMTAKTQASTPGMAGAGCGGPDSRTVVDLG